MQWERKIFGPKNIEWLHLSELLDAAAALAGGGVEAAEALPVAELVAGAAALEVLLQHHLPHPLVGDLVIVVVSQSEVVIEVT